MIWVKCWQIWRLKKKYVFYRFFRFCKFFIFFFCSFLLILKKKKSVFLLSFLIFKKVLLVPSAQWTGCEYVGHILFSRFRTVQWINQWITKVFVGQPWLHRVCQIGLDRKQKLFWNNTDIENKLGTWPYLKVHRFPLKITLLIQYLAY